MYSHGLNGNLFTLSDYRQKHPAFFVSDPPSILHPPHPSVIFFPPSFAEFVPLPFHPRFGPSAQPPFSRSVDLFFTTAPDVLRFTASYRFVCSGFPWNFLHAFRTHARHARIYTDATEFQVWNSCNFMHGNNVVRRVKNFDRPSLTILHWKRLNAIEFSAFSWKMHHQLQFFNIVSLVNDGARKQESQAFLFTLNIVHGWYSEITRTTIYCRLFFDTVFSITNFVNSRDSPNWNIFCQLFPGILHLKWFYLNGRWKKANNKQKNENLEFHLIIRRNFRENWSKMMQHKHK